MPKKQVKIMGVIHARGGSVRIPLKNIKPLNGKPLITYLIEAALNARSLERLIVSTDHPEIKRVALEAGAEVPFDRPKEISWDCPSELVTQHAVNFVEQEQGSIIEVAVTMQPTTPFMTGEDIDSCVRLLAEHPEWNSVFTANLVHERPEWMFSVGDDLSARKMQGGLITGETGISQTLPRLAVPNGGAYATRRAELFDRNLIIAESTGVHIMPRERSVDIDEPIDFAIAEFLARHMEGEHRG